MTGPKWKHRLHLPIRKPRSGAGGRRVERLPRQRQGRPAAGRQGREQTAAPGERRRLIQMTVSAILLVLIIAVKLAFPDVMDRYRVHLLRLLGEDTDFVEVFASAGKAVSPDGKLGDTFNEVYTAVFGPEKMPEEPEKNAGESGYAEGGASETGTVYSEENTPEIACMIQQLLGFAYQSPLEGELSSGFGYREHPVLGSQKFHYGLDIDADSGAVIHAFADGTVSVVAESTDLGKYVVVVHPNGYSTLYAHCRVVTASAGQQVKAGAPIAEVGDTGMTTGAHLHFELMHNADYLNPIYYVLG